MNKPFWVLLIILSLLLVNTSSVGSWYVNDIVLDHDDLGEAGKKISPRPILMPNGSIWLPIHIIQTNRCYVTKSWDGGATWTTPELWSNSYKYMGSVVKDYTVYAFYFEKIVQDTDSYCYMRYSTNNGSTWSSYITLQDYHNTDLLPRSYCQLATWDGIVLDNGRILVRCNGYNNPSLNDMTPCVIWTDDDGFQSGDWNGSVMYDGVYGSLELNTGSLIQLDNGTIWTMARNQDTGSPGGGTYQIWSTDTTGENYGDAHLLFNNEESESHAIRWTSGSNYNRSRILLAYNDNPSSRTDLTLALSYDELTSFDINKEIDGDASSDPHIVVLGNNTCCLFYSDNAAVDTIRVARFDISYLNATDTIEEINGTEFISIENQGNGANVYTGNPTFNFTRSSTGVQYQLQVDNNIDFSSPELDIDDINEYNYPAEYSENSTRVSFTVPSAYTLGKGYYYCRVRVLT